MKNLFRTRDCGLSLKEQSARVKEKPRTYKKGPRYVFNRVIPIFPANAPARGLAGSLSIRLLVPPPAMWQRGYPRSVLTAPRQGIRSAAPLGFLPKASLWPRVARVPVRGEALRHSSERFQLCWQARLPSRPYLRRQEARVPVGEGEAPRRSPLRLHPTPRANLPLRACPRIPQA